jgi:hypothetical protein
VGQVSCVWPRGASCLGKVEVREPGHGGVGEPV